jgi:hypothetical protein
MAQTAVEWLINYCERENWSLPSDIEEIAKEIEKEQIIDAFDSGLAYDYDESETYYKETFNK